MPARKGCDRATRGKALDYQLEQLGDERFQLLCQALLVAEFPAVQCTPVGQPDGGRDAFQLPLSYSATGRTGVALFQVKFVRRDEARDLRKWLLKVIEDELPKVRVLAERGARSYYLLTNVSGTSHLDSGSIDKLNELLASMLPIPAYVWWRDDICRRLETYPGVKWSYPEILRGSDLLPLLLAAGDEPNRKRRTLALRAFMAAQFENDEEVRFKQIELQNDLMKLFVDVPASLVKGPGNRRNRHIDRRVLDAIAEQVEGVANPGKGARSRRYDVDEETGIGAAALLLHQHAQSRFPFIVLEGAPGQGKSTLAQYACQVHRMQLLDKKQALKTLPAEHVPSNVRLPIKVDLREYAAWISGVNPFIEAEEAVRRPYESQNRRLEAFLTELVSSSSGGAGFTVDDLLLTFSESAVLLLLDGLDEVADLRRRQQVVSEITGASRRLSELAPQLQVIVTTRPSAFTGVAEFPVRQFHYFDLLPLTRGLTSRYATKWCVAKKISGREAAEVKKSLDIRLHQPHLRDLSRNPMQLAILLSVIHTRGASLPDKRTALYDIYVELFLAREAEKTEEVREHQELLIDVHRYLAWVLHAEAETGHELGRITTARLMALLEDYLSKEGRDVNLATELFVGCQRVVFLVARVEGTFEFEVQPLREYFAARHLYETASNGAEPGNRRERFTALARNPYWLNVTRFFAGCYSKGELPTLAADLRVLKEDPLYQLIGYPRSLVLTLAGDWVFSQHNKSLKEALAVALEDEGLRLVLMAAASQNRGAPRLPDGCGRRELIDAAIELLYKVDHKDQDFFSLCSLLQLNTSPDERLALWRSCADSGEMSTAKKSWLAHYLGITPLLTTRDLRVVGLEGEGLDDLLFILFINRQLAVLTKLDRRVRRRFEQLLLGRGIFPILSGPGWPYRASSALSVASYLPLFMGVDRRTSMEEARARHFSHRRLDGEDKSLSPFDPSTTTVNKFLAVVKEIEKRPVADWLDGPDLWEKLISTAQQELGETWAVRRLAILAAVAVNAPRRMADGAGESYGLFSSVPLWRRLLLARSRAGVVTWWREQLQGAATDEDKAFWILTALNIAGAKTLTALLSEIDAALAEIEEWNVVLEAQRELSSPISMGWPRPKSLVLSNLSQGLSPRTATLLASGPVSSQGRMELQDRYVDGYTGSDPAVLEQYQQMLLRRIRSLRKDDSWRSLVEVMRQSHGHPVQELAFEISELVRSDIEIPYDLAVDVCRNRDVSPSLAALAERRYERSLFGELPALVRVATDQRWFENL